VLGDNLLKEVKNIQTSIMNFTGVPDRPTSFYMNPLSDFNCRLIEVDCLIETMINVQPKDSGGSGGQSKDQVVKMQVSSFQNQFGESKIKMDLDKAEVSLQRKTGMFDESKVGKDGLTYPLNVFYKFEVQRFRSIQEIMNRTLSEIVMAIDGVIIMTADLDEAINSIFNNKIPNTWLFNAAGEEISWMMGSITTW